MALSEDRFWEDDRRDARAQVHDRILLLSLFARLDRCGFIGDPMKVQKSVFLAEYSAARTDALAFSHPYFRWKYGPFSKELKDDYSLLSDPQFRYLEGGDQFDLSPKGSALADAFWFDVLRMEENESIRKLLETVAYHCGSKNGWVLQKEANKLRVRSAPSRDSAADKEIEETVENTPQTYEFRVLPKEPRHILVIPEEWEETLAMELQIHSEARESLKRAQADIAAGRVSEGLGLPEDAEQ